MTKQRFLKVATACKGQGEKIDHIMLLTLAISI